jgi:hypothetical protein
MENLPSLSKQEVAILTAIINGCYTRELIANQLNIAPYTVKNHITNIAKKLRQLDVIREGEELSVPLILTFALRFERMGGIQAGVCLECLKQGNLADSRVNADDLCFGHWLSLLGQEN